MITLAALLPILCLLFLMVVLEKPAYISAPISLAVTVLLSVFVWRMDSVWLGASLVRGGLISLEIIFILTGVFLLVSVLRKTDAFPIIDNLISKLSRDVRVQAILLAWFLVAFIEGVAGFGTPSMVAVPLMVALGFSPLAAVVTTLIGDGVAVTFGAAGTPMIVGVAQGVALEQTYNLGADFVSKVFMSTALIHLLFGTFVPFAILCVLDYIYHRSLRKALAAWKLAVLSGLSLTVPSLLIAYFFGPELPSILGSIIGVTIMVILIRWKKFLPKDEWILEKKVVAERMARAVIPRGDYLKAVMPYILVIGLLLISRANLADGGTALRKISLSASRVFGTEIGYTLHPFYSPGFFFLVAAMAAFIYYKLSWRDAREVVSYTLVRIIKTAVALVSVLGVVQILIYSSHNSSGYLSFSEQIVSLLTKTGFAWPIFAPIIGLFGAFIAGSSTVSNLMFSSLQVEAALAVGMSPILGLALQSIGSAVGNMIAIHNIIAAAAVVHLAHPEGKVIKYSAWPAVGYAFAAGILGFLIFGLS